MGEFSKRVVKPTVQAVDQFSKNEKLEAKYEKVKEYAKQIGINTDVKRLILHEVPFVRYESDIDFLSNLKYYENAKTIR